MTRTVFGQDINALAHTVHTAGQRLDLVHRFRPGSNRTIGKHRVKSGANGTQAQQPGPTGVHAHDFFFIGPAGHELVQLSGLQGVIKRSLNIIG